MGTRAAFTAGLKTLANVPGHFAASLFRSAQLSGTRRQVSIVTNTFFLHVHAARVRPDSLRATTTLGLGVMTISLFLITLLTGVLLSFYYAPTPGRAYASLQDLIYVVPFGRLVRNLHRWAAEAMVVTAGLHLLRVFYTGAYKRPREFNWVVGVALLVLTLLLSFTGYLLPWDQLAYWAITAGTNIAAYAPIIGPALRLLLLGEESVGGAALLRFYVLHVLLLPGSLVVLIGYHLFRIRKDGGLARGSARTDGQGILTYPHLLYMELAIFAAILALLLPAAHLFDAPLGAPVDPFHPPNPAKAPWYLVGFQELVSYSAFWGGGVLPLVLLSALLLLPYVDRDPRGVGTWFARERRAMVFVGTALTLLAVALTVVGAWFRGPSWEFYWPWQGWPGPR